MSALPKFPLFSTAMGKSRQAEIEEFMRKRPDKVTVLPPVPEAEDVPEVEVAETVDKTVIGTTWGTYRRRKHRGSDDQ